MCFQCLQGYWKSINSPSDKTEPPSAIIYYVFDILYLDGYDLKGVPLGKRKELLRGVFSGTEDVRLVEYFDKNGQTVYRAAIENGMEGVVAKQKDSVYEPGNARRTGLK